MESHPRAQVAGVGEAPRHEIAGDRAHGCNGLWGFDRGRRYRGAALMPGWPWRDDRRAHQRGMEAETGFYGKRAGARRWPGRHVGPRASVAGPGPAIEGSILSGVEHRLPHEVSILPGATTAGVGPYLGTLPRAKISMMSILPPQQGQGLCSDAGSAAMSSLGFASVGTGAVAVTFNSARTLAILAARQPWASSP